jgi:signal transduction histidine kinase
VPGVGLDLTIARAAVAAHRDSLEVTGDLRGTTARVTLPAIA